MGGLIALLCTTVNAGPAKDALYEMQKSIPHDVQKWMADQDSKVKREAGTPHIVVAGDSWADVVGEGGDSSFLMKRLTAHGCKATSSNIAIPGTTSGMWATAPFLAGLKLAVKGADYLYLMLGGNDCLDLMPDCAQTKKSASECGDQLVASATANVHKMLAAVQEANPKSFRNVHPRAPLMHNSTGASTLNLSRFKGYLMAWQRIIHSLTSQVSSVPRRLQVETQKQAPTPRTGTLIWTQWGQASSGPSVGRASTQDSTAVTTQ